MHNLYFSEDLIKIILKNYSLPINGIHGLPHWARVMENGLRLAEMNGADKEVVALFAIFHDSKRQNESKDNGHGKRGGEFAKTLRNKILKLDNNKFNLLYYACEYHTKGLTEGNITVQTCWDSDRLDLNRVKIKTDPNKLCTIEAKNPEILDWAGKRAGNLYIPKIVNIWKKYIPLNFIL